MKENQLSRYGAVAKSLPFTSGKIFFVVKGMDAWAQELLNEFPPDKDGQSRVFVATATNSDTTGNDNLAIQAALDACVAGRNDYVMVMPSSYDYNIATTLTMTKRGVHLIAPAGMTYERGANNSTKLHLITAALPMITVTGDNCEIAGFYMKNFYDGTLACGQHILLGAGSTGCTVRHNHFVVRPANATNTAVVEGTSTGAGYARIENNWFESQASGAYTIPAYVTAAAGATHLRVCNNDMEASQGNIVTTAIGLPQFGLASGNWIIAVVANPSQATLAGVITTGITLTASAAAINNYFCNCVANLTGGTAGSSYTGNKSSATGDTGGYSTNLEA